MMKYDTLGSMLCTLALAGSTLSTQGQEVILRGDAPPNDECPGAVAQTLTIGGSIQFTGDNTGANILEGTPFVVVWEAFTLEDCATIQIDHCLDGFIYESFLNTITNSCPDIDSGLVSAGIIEECQMVFNDLGPGTWYVPVLVDPDMTPVGNYAFTISAMECDPEYCLGEGLSQDHTGSIVGVEFGSLSYSTPPIDVGYVDNTLEVADVGTGIQHGITIVLDQSQVVGTASDTAQILIWIDFDQNGTFTDPGELVHISPDPFTGAVQTGLINVPSSATLGITRMRIRLHDRHDGSEYDNEPNNTPCDGSSFGQVMDFSVNVDLGTSIQEIQNTDVVLYPNPSNGNMELITEMLAGSVYLEVIDFTGRPVHQLNANIMAGEPLALSFSDELLPGGYLLTLTTANERITRRIVIR